MNFLRVLLEKTLRTQFARSHQKQIKRTRGDTIVEVMIAVAIVSSVLAGAFTVSQRSALAVRDSQERAEMTQHLQGQVELVRALALVETTDTAGVFRSSPRYFCVNEATRDRQDFSLSVHMLPSLNNDDFSIYPAACKNIGSRNNISIRYNSSTKVFTFVGRWDGIDGSKKQTQLSYRIYPGRS